MKNTNGKPQNRGINYERKKTRDHGFKHLGGPGKPDGIKKGGSKVEVKNWQKPIHKTIVVKAKRKGVNEIISKSGFTAPAVSYGSSKRMKLYQGKKRLT